MPRKSKCLQCDKQPLWKIPGEKYEYCNEHSDEKTMVKKKRSQPKKCECKKTATWKYKDKVYSHCDVCKKDGMIRKKVSNNCKTQDCKAKAVYGIEGGKPEYCSEHKGAMVNRKHKMCVACKAKRAYYGIKPNATHCSDCNTGLKLGYTDIVSTMCKDCGIVRASFKFLDTKGFTHCVRCKIPGMMSTKVKCDECKGKKKVASFGFPGTRPTRCKDHMDKKTMIDTAHTKCDKCHIQRPTFGFHQPTRCFTCKDIEMKDKANPLCLFCNTTRAIPKYNNHCHKCYYELNPEAPRTRYFGHKEAAVIKYIKDNFEADKSVLNKPIDGGSSSYRPDFYLDCKTHVIIIEIDEYQHRSYVPNPDRDVTLRADAKKPTHIIHFNPDQYDNVKSPWRDDTVTNLTDWDARLLKLGEAIDVCRDTIPVGLNSIKLYFN